MYAVLVSPAEISNIFTHMIDAYLTRHRTATSTDDDDDPAVQSAGDEDKSQASAHGDAYNVAYAGSYCTMSSTTTDTLGPIL